MRRILAMAAVVVLMGALPGLARAEEAAPASSGAQAAQQQSDDARALEARARAYWKARAAGDPSVMDFYAPPEKGGPKRARDVSEFGNVAYRSFEIRGVEVDGDTGVVEIAIETDFPLPVPAEVAKRVRNRTLHERWDKVDGIWYKRPIPRGFSRRGPPADAAPADSTPAPDAGAKASPADRAEAER